MKVNLNQAVQIIRKGGILIFPTDTAFGMGCRIDDKKAVDKLFDIRNRAENKAVPVLFDSSKQVRQYVLSFDKDVENLMTKYWPGALTIVLKCRRNMVPSLVRGGGDSLGVRIPDHSLILNLIRQVGVPIVGTSANFAGEKTPFKLKDVDEGLILKVDGVLVAESKGRQASTVVDCTQKPWRVLRQGVLTL